MKRKQKATGGRTDWPVVKENLEQKTRARVVSESNPPHGV